ncbi:MAG: serine/threonine protein kinase [Sandaracinaceae bacterium]|nr:serine/threonine protein kinase [Sandaracinaceae bacterium]
MRAHEQPDDAGTAPMTPVDGGAGVDPSARTLRSATRPTRADGAPSVEPGTTAVGRQRALVDREELRGERRRVLTAVFFGLVGWNAFAALDLVRWLLGLHSDLLAPVLARAAISLPVLALYLSLRARAEASRGAVRALEVFAFGSGGAGIGALAIVDGEGLESYHLQGAVLVVLGHALTLGSHYRRALTPIALTAVGVPAVLGLASLFDAGIAAQWRSPAALASFVQDYTFVLGGAGLALFGGHAVSALRREVARSRSIGRYELRTKIAAGGMGEVWSAYHAGLKRDVAVKLMQPRLGQDARAIERFEREVRALAELTHPYVVRVFDYGATEDGVWYYAMELLDGDDLRSVIEREGPLEPARAVRLVTQASDALAEAHARGIVHRDVKPANLLLTVHEGGGELVKLIDFGIAKLGAHDGGELTETGMVVGTPGYMAPEVIMGGEASPRADVYALGAVLYYLLAGKAPLDASTPQALALAHVGQDVPPPSERLGRALPPALEAVVMRCLHKDAALRFADAGALAAALRAADERP